ncbi:membrane protein insertase YidC [Pseudoglutamicibacter cumminsii]|uniref:membrane protein insertase YidC n=1 Tax=Pseudoglutamicibacter cumminsii TaxID=156979 RepID=UPI0021A4CCFC|nr:membrane protein insertase YidC [Pseudoglutamicibacter cumminsii]MCT1685313.1 membrane protein insertase YidC [Pseudoglutamicibacter cumminsii]
MNFFNWLLTPFRWVMSFLMDMFHSLFSFLGLDPDSGWTWTLAIVLVTVIVRAALIPVFARQIRAQRAMQVVQPELRKLQQKYKGKRDQLSQQAMLAEQRALFKKHNTSMFASCMPLLIQMPFFFALFQVLNGSARAANDNDNIAALSAEKVRSFHDAKIFGARLSDTFVGTLGSDSPNASVIIVAIVLILAMVGLMFFTQRQLMTKNMTPEAQQGQFARQQRMMLYFLPIVFGIGGINFPLGLLVYWTATNLWVLGQQMWVIKRNPTPGSLAEKELNIRRAARGLPPIGEKGKPAQEENTKTNQTHVRGQRVQPQRKNRKKRK